MAGLTPCRLLLIAALCNACRGFWWGCVCSVDEREELDACWWSEVLGWKVHPRFLSVPFSVPETSEASLGEKGPTEGVCVLHICSRPVADDQLHVVACAEPLQLPNRSADEWVASSSRICCANCSPIVRKEQHHLSSPKLNPSPGSHQQIEALD